MKTILLCLVAVLATAQGSRAQDTSCGIVWLPPLQLSPDSDKYAGIPSVAVQGDTVHVTWWASSASNFPYMRSVNGGKTFEPLRGIAPDSVGRADPCYLVSAGKRLHALFSATKDSGTYWTTYSMYSDDRGTTWSQPRGLAFFAFPWSRAARGDTAVFMANAGGHPVVHTTDGGNSWVQAATLLWGRNLYVTMASEAVHFTLGPDYWPSAYPTPFAIQYKRSTDLGNTWPDSLWLSSVSSLWSDESVIAADDQADSSIVLTAWQDAEYGCMTNVGCSQIARWSFDNGRTFQPEFRLDQQPAGYATVAVVRESTMAVAWLDDLSDNGDICLSTDRGVHWCSPFATSDSSTGITVALSASGTIHAAFEEYGDINLGNFHIVYRRGIILSAQRPGFSVAPSSLSFGETMVSCRTIQSVTVKNTGGATLLVQSAVSGDSSFAVTPASGSVNPYDSLRFFATFSPANAGVKSASIVFTHNAQGSPDTVSVNGTGTGSSATAVVTNPWANGWQLVSLPVTVLCPYTAGSLFAFASGYVPRDTMVVGTGYWLKLGAPNLRFVGFSVTSDTVQVRSKWNIVGSISVPVAVADIGSDPPGMVTSQFFGYAGTYVVADTIQPGKAYWVKVNQSGELILSSSPGMAKAGERIQIVATDELPPPPPGGEVNPNNPITPGEFLLEQNYPNPFNPSTVISYQLMAKSYVTLIVFNMLGQEVATLVNGYQDAGYRSVKWDASKLPTGVYFYRLTAGASMQTRKLLLIR